MGTDMRIKNIIISASVLCSVAFTQPISGQSRAKAAYLSSNISELVNIACSDTGEDSKLATEFIALSDIVHYKSWHKQHLYPLIKGYLIC